MGVSGSGKTTVGQQLATDLGWLYSEGDDFHSVENVAKMSRGIPLTDDDRSDWLALISHYIENQIKLSQHTVISCSALKQAYRRQLQLDIELVKFVYLKGSKALIIKRLQSRLGHFMKAELLASQFDALEEPENTLIVEIIHSPEQISENIQAYYGLGTRTE